MEEICNCEISEVVEIEFRSQRLGYYLNTENLELWPDLQIIVGVERGEDIARVVHASMPIHQADVCCEKLKENIIKRIATPEDLLQLDVIIEKEETATEKYLEILGRYPFEMKLIETIYQLDGNKVTFYFTADGRVDFRAFVRELASVFKTRIELHQTSGRDEAKRLGGYGMCGNKYCCASFMKRFSQVTIKMAKDQNLSNNLSKISGPCGRLLCCLHYEENYYLETAKEFPEIGEEFNREGCKLYVYKNDYYNNKVHLASDNQELIVIDLEEYLKSK